MRSMYSIREATASEMLAHASELFAEHYDEIALNKQVMQLKPDADKYLELEANGSLFILAAYSDGNLVGYSVNFTTSHMHYSDLIVASNDLLFVSKPHRKGKVGLKLIKATEAKARDVGAKLMLWHAKPDTALVELLPRLGYGVQDIIFSTEV